ncbi:MAG: hypothetical protein GY711_27980 [bacterium]|nr:hypothetical protein [bacterium]
MPTLKLLSVLSLLAFTAPASAQNFQFPDFSNTSNLVFNGTAATAGNVLRVTAANISERGSAWYDTPVDVSSGFETTFTFQISNPAAGGGDGMAFLIHNDAAGLAALGNHASAMGYGGFAATPQNGLDSSLAIEIDTYNNGNVGDLDANHISVHTGGPGDNSQDEVLSIGRAPASSDMSDGLVHTVRIRNSGGVLEVYLDDLTTPLITASYDVINGGTYLTGGPAAGLSLIGGTSAYVGFTAGNGGAWEDHDVLSWTFSGGELGVPDATCDSLTLPNSTGLPALIELAGSGVAGMPIQGTVSQGPPGQFGFFITGPNAGFYIVPPGSSGTICIESPQFRYNSVPLGQVFQFDAAGVSQAVVGGGPSLLPTDGSFGGVPAVLSGETRFFQAWFRETGSSNFTSSLGVMFL